MYALLPVSQTKALKLHIVERLCTEIKPGYACILVVQMKTSQCRSSA